jgi:hypothetical protein
MLRQENAVRMVRPTGTSLPDVIGAETRRKVPAGYGTANVFDEPAHSAKWASTHQSPSLTGGTDRSAA